MKLQPSYNFQFIRPKSYLKRLREALKTSGGTKSYPKRPHDDPKKRGRPKSYPKRQHESPKIRDRSEGPTVQERAFKRGTTLCCWRPRTATSIFELRCVRTCDCECNTETDRRGRGDALFPNSISPRQKHMLQPSGDERLCFLFIEIKRKEKRSTGRDKII